MRARAKRLPRLWCALQGLLPLEVGARPGGGPAGECALERSPRPPTSRAFAQTEIRGRLAEAVSGNRIAVAGRSRDVGGDGPF